jgi:hypothetical protein
VQKASKSTANARHKYLADESEKIKSQLQSDANKYSSFKGKQTNFGAKKKKPAKKAKTKNTGLTTEQKKLLERKDLGEAAEW